MAETGLGRVVEAATVAIARATLGGDVVVGAYAAPLVVAATAQRRGPLLVITPTATEAAAMRDDLRALGLGTDDVALWPGWDTHPLERVSPDAGDMATRHLTRWRVATQAPAVVVSSVRALAQSLAPEPLEDPVVLTRGGVCDRDDLIARLAGFGYRREHAVEHRGEFAVRGGIVDVWPAQSDEPVRCDLFGDEIDRLAIFDVATQRSTSDVHEVIVAAAREWRPDRATRALADELADELAWAREPLARISDGVLFDGMEGWLAFFNESPQTLLDEWPDASVVLVDPGRIRERLRDALDEERDLVDAVGRTWGVEGDLPLLHLDIHDQLTARSALAISGVPTSPASVVLAAQNPPVVQGDPGRLAQHVRNWPAARRGVIAATSAASARRITELLSAEGVDVANGDDAALRVRVAVVVAPLGHGFALEEPDIVVWSESDITGRRAVHRAPRARARAADGFFDGLSVGSYVVHRQYGVAKFAGSTTRAINGVTRDYLVLEFKDGKSYWPTDQMDALTPYGGGDAPALSRMGSEQWQKTRAKARAAAALVAQDLVELYRQRLVVPGHAFSADTTWQYEMESLFPYTETADQLRAILEVKADMESPRPMDRLVCADVGFGKTEIAVRAAFKAVQDHKQAAILVPTTLLASQHYATLTERFAGFPVNVALLSRFVDDREAERTVAGLKEGTVDVVVGTHRLLDQRVVFKSLGLLVVDEEQRFGVTHKEAIKQRAAGVDVLTLTASPIPRTLEMAFTGIRDLSMITTPPAERRPILTHVGEYEEAAVVEAIRRELLREGQVFFVHNRVADIDEVAQRLGRLVPDARIAVAHGQMDEGTLETIVDDFWQRRYDVLVCTTIVESGIDMPTVNTLIVDRAELLGLGQLHQLRGRVGRANARAYAYLFHPRDRVLSETAYERLRTIGDNTALGSGFKIAMRDLEIRGAGNLLGHDQSGPVAAVGYDLYVQLVAEAVAQAKGEFVTPVATVSLDVPGEASLPVSYVAAEDDRLEAYRRLGGVSDASELADVRAEWEDRFGPLPRPAEGLIELAALRLVCLRLGVTDVVVQPARVGVRSKPVVKVGHLALAVSTQLRLRRTLGATYDETAHVLRFESNADGVTPTALTALLESLIPATPVAV